MDSSQDVVTFILARISVLRRRSETVELIVQWCQPWHGGIVSEFVGVQSPFSYPTQILTNFNHLPFSIMNESQGPKLIQEFLS